MATPIKKSGFLPMVILGLLLVMPGCDGTPPREQIDDTVKEFSGQKNIERMEQMKQDIGAIQNQQEDRLNRLDNGTDQ